MFTTIASLGMNGLRRQHAFSLAPMTKGRCLGLVGGLGVGAAIHYYRNLAKAHAAQGRALDLTMAHAETDRVYEYLQAKDRMGLAEYLNGLITRLKAAGAEFAVIPAVTPHFCIRELEGISPLPILSIFEPLVEELQARNIKRLAVFGTRFVIESGLFGLAGGVEFCRVMPEELKYIHATYTELARQGKGTNEQVVGLTKLAHTLMQREKVDAVLLGGTDLSLLFDESNTDFPFVDCAELHIRRIAGAMIG